MAQRTKVTIPYLREKKAQGRPITMLTAYDFPIANIEDEIGIDIILCGDSLGMTVYGFSGTNPARERRVGGKGRHHTRRNDGRGPRSGLQEMRDEGTAGHTDAARGKHLAGFESKTLKF